MSSGIYQIVNSISQKRYIGCSKNIEYRCRKHKEALLSNRHCNAYLQAAWNKYTQYNFTFDVLEICNEEDLFKKEDYWVKILNTTNREFGYNLALTDPKNRKHITEETRLKMGRVHAGYKWTKEQVDKRQLTRKINNIKPPSDFVSLKVIELDTDNNIICYYNSISEVARKYKVTVASIRYIIKNKSSKKLKGKVFKIRDNDNNK